MKKCDNCGTDISSGVKICPQCKAKNKRPVTQKLWFWIIVVLVGLGVISSLLNSGGHSSRPSGNSSTVPPISNSDNESTTTPSGTSDTTPNENAGSNSDSVLPENNTATSTPELTDSTSTQSADSAYQTILDEYSEKLRMATPGLIDEYNAEAAQNADGLEGLAEISNAKITELAELSNEGVSEMAEVMMSTGSGKYDVYEEWAKKLMDIYMEESEKITDAYMASAIG